MTGPCDREHAWHAHRVATLTVECCDVGDFVKAMERLSSVQTDLLLEGIEATLETSERMVAEPVDDDGDHEHAQA